MPSQLPARIRERRGSPLRTTTTPLLFTPSHEYDLPSVRPVAAESTREHAQPVGHPDLIDDLAARGDAAHRCAQRVRRPHVALSVERGPQRPPSRLS